MRRACAAAARVSKPEAALLARRLEGWQQGRALPSFETPASQAPQLDFGQFVRPPMREIPHNIGVREFLDGPGLAQDHKKFQPFSKHLQIAYIWAVRIGQSRAQDEAGVLRDFRKTPECR
jgi:hypothetical protein